MRGRHPRAAVGDSWAELVGALQDPAVYGSSERVELHETHISMVFVSGNRAYKLKKPIRLPFLDYGTLDRRREMCLEEVRLNRRLAPCIYLGVRALIAKGGDIRLDDFDAEGAIDYVVEMRRFRDVDTLAQALEREVDGRIGEVARVLRRFHAGAEVCHPSDVVGDWRSTLDENFRTLAELESSRCRALQAHRVFAEAYLRRRATVLRRRVVDGQVRDGHGDLRTDHVLLEHQISIVDCVEFNPSLRRVDVSADLAYLLTDLATRARPREAAQLVEAYRAAGGDVGDDSLVSFFCAYRALVAAKVALLRGDPRAAADADSLLDLATRYEWQARLPLAIVVCGLSGSGKSVLAETIGRQSGLAVLNSDRVRKALVGVSATEKAPPAAYFPEMTRRTYAELGRRARTAVRDAGGVVVDATFHRREQREQFLNAYSAAVAPVFLRCTAPDDIMRRRLQVRERDPMRVSDANCEVLDRQLAATEPFEASADVVVVSTDAARDEVFRSAVSLLDLALGERAEPPDPAA